MEFWLIWVTKAVLVAISIPVFTTQLEKSREATDLANLRAAYEEQTSELLTWDGTSTIADKTVTAKQTQANWQSQGNSVNYDNVGGLNVACSTTSWTVKADTANSRVTITAN